MIYIRYSPRAKGFPRNWDLDLWKFGISVCWWRYPKLFISWSKEWLVGTSDPHNICEYDKTKYDDWFVWGLEVGGRNQFIWGKA